MVQLDDLLAWKPPTLTSAQEARDEAIEKHASRDREWSERAHTWLQGYLEGHETFFPDDVWAAGLEEPRDARAFGAVVQRAARAGLIVKTGEVRQRTRGNASWAVVWRSMRWRP